VSPYKNLQQELQNWGVKQYLIISGKKSLNKALEQALMLEAVETAAGPPLRPQEVQAKPTWEQCCQ
jgi:hypothetical protein